MNTLALYTTVYPAALPYLHDWHRSISAQTDSGFDLWIGLDGLTPAEANRTLDTRVAATWIEAQPGDTPISLRSRTLLEICGRYDGVVLVDSDDILHESRVEAARRGLESADVYGCAMDIIDEKGRDLGLRFGPPEGGGFDLDAMIAEVNIFGMSNTAWRCETLKRCLPVSPDCALMDWCLATRAWGFGARFLFDPASRMGYRQYDANTARVVPPFSPAHVAEAARRAVGHYSHVLATDSMDMPVAKRRRLETAFARASEFIFAMSASPDRLARYAEAFNRLPPQLVWWACVAHPALEDLWKT